MAPVETILFWSCLVVYALVTGALAYAFVFKNDKILPKVTIAIGVGLALHTGAITARFVAQGHLPWSGDYENGLLGGWFIVASTLFVAVRRPAMRAIALGTLPLTLLLMGFGVMRKPELGPMAASLKSFWLYIHVYFAWLAFGAFALAMAAGILYLMKERDGTRETANPVYERLPSLERLDELMFRYLIFGLITDTVMIAAGAIWAKELWGSYWSWDPVETWSLITWLIVGAAIHLRVTRKWRGRRLAWLSIAAVIGSVITFFGVTFVVESSNHIFNVR